MWNFPPPSAAMCLQPTWFSTGLLACLLVLRESRRLKWKNCGALQFAPFKAMNTDRDKRDPVQIYLAIYFHFKASMKVESNKALFIALMHLSRCESTHTEMHADTHTHTHTHT